MILTTAANDSMKPVHDRMPLLLERDEIGKWLFEDNLIEAFLHKIPALHFVWHRILNTFRLEVNTVKKT